jgi:hypothetical protein
MGKQYKKLTPADIEFIKKQKLFYIASASNKEVNLSPKGYDTIRVLDETTVVFLDYPGSGNRTYRDCENDGEFTILFNAFEGRAKILRLFCKAKLIAHDTQEFEKNLSLFDIDKNLVRNFFEFHIYALESSCGDGVPYMEYKEERPSLKKWAIKMDKSEKLQKYIQDHATPPDLSKI